MKPIAIAAALALFGMTAPANAQCTETDGYVYVFSQCQQQETSQSPDLCQHKPGQDPKFMYFVSNVILDEVADRSALGSLFYHVIGAQHDVALNGTSSPCFKTPEAAMENRTQTIARYRDSFENVVVKEVMFDTQ